MDVKGKLYYGDNLEVLRNHIPSESVDLIYLDPAVQLQRHIQCALQVPEDRGRFQLADPSL